DFALLSAAILYASCIREAHWCGASEEEFGLGVQLGFPVDDRGLFENGLFLLTVGVSASDCSQTLFPHHDVTFQGSQSVE
ncbi:hypothetical protein XENOCAPTIV_020757, partial [Xenoophorus captivus]